MHLSNISITTFILSVVLKFFVSSAIAQEPSWSLQSSGTTNWLTDIHFTDEMNGWAVGWSGTILHTSDGGALWTSQTSGVSSALQSVYFTDSMTGWAVGGSILHTTDGGVNWSEQVSPFGWFGTYLESVYFINDQIGWAAGSDGGAGQAIRTVDGGQTWLVSSVQPTHGIQGMTFVDELKGYAVGGPFITSGRIYATVDGGDTWYQISSGNWIYRDVSCYGTQRCRVVGHPGTLYTEDGGETWVSGSIPSGETNSVFILNESVTWAAREGSLAVNNGASPNSWQLQSSASGHLPVATGSWNSVFFVNENRGWAVGSGGHIIHYSPDSNPATSVSDSDKIIESLKVYPNPAEDFVTINFQIKELGIEAIITDITGRTVLQRPLTEGRSHVLDLRDVPRGMYNLSVTDGRQLHENVKLVRQ